MKACLLCWMMNVRRHSGPTAICCAASDAKMRKCNADAPVVYLQRRDLACRQPAAAREAKPDDVAVSNSMRSRLTFPRTSC